MKKEWFSTKELTSIEGLPGTVQGVNQKARRENWISRRKSGTQGKALEYHVNNFSENVRNQLYSVAENTVNYQSDNNNENEIILIDILKGLTIEEKKILKNWIIRNGVSHLLKVLIDSEQEKIKSYKKILAEELED